MRKNLLHITFILALLMGFAKAKAQSPNGTIVFSTGNTICAGTSGYMYLQGASASANHWIVSTNGGVVWAPIPTANDTISFFQPNNNLCYKAILTNGDSSAMACLSVDQHSDAGIIKGGGVYCGTATGQLKDSASTGTVLGWYQQVGATFTSLSNTTPTYNFSGITSTTTFAFFTKNGVCPADTAKVTISLDQPSNAGTVTGATTVCVTSNSGTLSDLTGVVGNITGWNYSTNNGSTWSNLGTTANTYTFNNLTQNTWYYVIAKNGVCPADTSNTAIISIDQAPVAGVVTGGGYFCGVLPTGTLTLSGYSGTIVQWQSATSSSGPWTSTSCTGTTCNYATGATPQTFYHVEIDNGVCPSVFSVQDTVTFSASSVAGILTTSDDTVCAGVGAPTLTLAGYTGNSFQWQMSTDNGTTWINLPYTTAVANLSPLIDTTMYRAIIKNNNCAAVTSNSVSIVVNPSPTVSIATANSPIMIGQSLSIAATGSGGSPVWSPALGLSSTTTFNTIATPTVTTNYTITVDGGNGCIVKDSIRVTITPLEFTNMIANTLTPNGDGINDAFYIANIEAFKSSDLSIFNEYGQEIYKAAPYMNDWKGTYNGNRLPDGTYFYVLKFTDTGSIYKGNITLINQK